MAIQQYSFVSQCDLGLKAM